MMKMLTYQWDNVVDDNDDFDANDLVKEQPVKGQTPSGGYQLTQG